MPLAMLDLPAFAVKVAGRGKWLNSKLRSWVNICHAPLGLGGVSVNELRIFDYRARFVETCQGPALF